MLVRFLIMCSKIKYGMKWKHTAHVLGGILVVYRLFVRLCILVGPIKDTPCWKMVCCHYLLYPVNKNLLFAAILLIKTWYQAISIWSTCRINIIIYHVRQPIQSYLEIWRNHSVPPGSKRGVGVSKKKIIVSRR